VSFGRGHSGAGRHAARGQGRVDFARDAQEGAQGAHL